MTDSYKEHESFICVCMDPNHQIILRYDDEDELVYLEVKLNHFRGFFTRLYYGIRYIFGKKSLYGDYAEIQLDKDDNRRLLHYFDDVLNKKGK